MKNIILLLFPLLLLIPMTSESQSFVKSERINFTDINLRDSLHVLAHIDAFIPVPGDVIIRFTGECYTSPGDWTILAANNAPKWDKNFGNVGVQSTDSTIGKSFSHSKIVKYSKSDTGIHSYYAVAQDWGYMAGSGIVSVYGTLTIEFLPYGSLYSMAHGSFAFNGDVTKIVFATQETVFASSVGKIITHMDGWGHTNVGDRIIYAVSNSSLWLPDDGNVSVEAADPTLDVNTFSHTRVYNVPFAGPYIYNALIQNSEETDGNGTVLVYGLIRSTFYSSTGPVQVESQGFSKPNVDLNDQFISLTSVSIDVPEAGDVLVELDGELISDPGMLH